MPSTVNGIGTSYHGRKNVSTRVGTCPSCKRTTTLSSYDTRVYFCVIFIPIIPFERKRIIDQCAACRVHYAMDLAKWDAARQLEISGAKSKFKEFRTPENAFELHQQLVAFHEFEDAAALRKQIRESYPHNALLFIQLARALIPLGLMAEVEGFYQRAHEIDPSMPEAKIGLARARISRNQLSEARALLSFLIAPGSSQIYSLDVLYLLAEAYQKAHQPAETLVLCAFLQAELPHITDDPRFRKLARSAEKVAGGDYKILPKVKKSWRHFVGLKRNPDWPGYLRPTVFVVLLLATGLFTILGVNLYWKRATLVYVVKSSKSTSSVEIDGKIYPLPDEVTSIRVGEGTHHAKFGSGPDIPFEIESFFPDRVKSKTVWVITDNPHVVLEREIAHYSNKAASPSQFFYYSGKQFHFVSQISHPFVALPREIALNNRSREDTRSALRIPKTPSVQILNNWITTSPLDALTFAEQELDRDPTDDQLLESYFTGCLQRATADRAFAFIGERADKNGLLEWHRYSQELSGLLHKDKVMLVVKYRLLLKKNPGNATYLYLMGRVAESSQESQMLFEQAAAADPNSPYPRIALAFNALSDGDFQKALSECGKAKTSSKTLNRKLEAMALDAALGLRQFDRVEEIAAARLAKSKSDLAAEGMLLESRILKGDAPGADSQFASFAKVLKSQIGATADDYIAAEQNQILYMKGDFATLLYRLKGSRNPFLFFATLERGSPELAEKLMPQDASLGYYQLLQSMAYRKSGNEEAAGKWEKKAMETIASADPGNRAADLLSLGRAPVDGEIQAFRAPLNTKRIVLGALCLKYPAKQKEYGPLLDKLNVHLDFPHHFLSRIAAGK